MTALRLPRRRDRIAARRADFAWFAGLLVFTVVAADVWIDCRKQEWHDEEYGHRRDLLRAQVAEHPDRPILLALGSSRVGLGFRPEALPELCTAEGRPVIPFNGSHLAGGPTMNQVMLRRFVRDGFRPRWLVVEAAPLLLNHESTAIPTTAATAFDLPYTLPYLPLGKVAMVFARSRLNPFYKHRQYVMESYAPALAWPRLAGDDFPMGPLGGCLGDGCPVSMPPEMIERLTATTLRNDRAALTRFAPDPSCDRALRDLAAWAVKEGIGVTLLLTPESSRYRALYTETAQEAIARYGDGLESQFGVTVVDARDWLEDDGFYDGHHMLREASARFTRRLGERVLGPLVAGQALPHTSGGPSVGVH
jgi:hypothetical protein